MRHLDSIKRLLYMYNMLFMHHISYQLEYNRPCCLRIELCLCLDRWIGGSRSSSITGSPGTWGSLTEMSVARRAFHNISLKQIHTTRGLAVYKRHKLGTARQFPIRDVTTTCLCLSPACNLTSGIPTHFSFVFFLLLIMPLYMTKHS